MTPDYPDSTNRGAVQNGKMAAPMETQPEESRPPPPSRRQRGLVKSRFKGFSDDDDDDVKPSMSSIPVEGTRTQPEPSQHQTQHTEGSDTADIATSRKRPAPEPDDAEEFVDQLLPAAAAMKRRRLEEARLRGESPSATFNKEPSPPTQQQKPAKKATSELDIKKSLRERRAASDKAAARESEDLHEGLETADIEAMRDLAVVEEFEIPPPRSNGAAHHHSNQKNGERWNPAWNGRKNFKKFRRQGEAGAARRGGGQGVIVPLEEVKKRDFGIGEGYWLESSSSLKRKRDNKASQVVEEEGGNQVEGSAMTTTKAKAGERKKKVPKELLQEGGGETSGDEEMGDVVDVEAPRRTRGQTQTQTSGGGASGASKGRAVGAPKKQGRLFEAKGGDVGRGGGGGGGSDDESEEDELKFRFGKRRRLQQ